MCYHKKVTFIKHYLFLPWGGGGIPEIKIKINYNKNSISITFLFVKYKKWTHKLKVIFKTFYQKTKYFKENKK